MDIHKEFLRRLATARKEIAIKLEELLGPDQSLKIYHRKLGDWNMDVIAKNEKILVIANDNFKESFEKVNFEKTFEAKGKYYKAEFKSGYEQCQAAVKSNGNLSLNASVLGVAGPLYDAERHSNGYPIYDDLIFRVSDLYHLDEEFFSKIKNYGEEDISINNLAKLVYDLDKETINREVVEC